MTFALLLIAAVLVFSLIFYKNAERQALLSATDALEANTQQMAYLLDDLFYQMDILSLQLTSASDLQIYDYRYAVCSKWWILYFDAFLYLGLSKNSNQMCKMPKATQIAATITKARKESSRLS